MVTVEVKSAELLPKQVTSKKTGEVFNFREQEMYIDLGQAYPVRIIWSLGKEDSAFPVGRYTLDKSGFRVTRFGGLEVDLRKLKPAVAAARAAS